MMFELDDILEISTPETASSGMSMISNKSNPFFAGMVYSKPLEIPKLDDATEGPQTPTTYQVLEINSVPHPHNSFQNLVAPLNPLCSQVLNI